jgi:hypothetical protein
MKKEYTFISEMGEHQALSGAGEGIVPAQSGWHTTAFIANKRRSFFLTNNKQITVSLGRRLRYMLMLF